MTVAAVITVVPASTDDAPVVRRIMLEAFEEHRALVPPSSALSETLEDVEAQMAQGGAVLAYLEGVPEPVGCGRYRVEPEWLYVGRVAVLPAYRRRGVARAIMLALEDEARARGRGAIRIGVRIALESNVRLYESLGYEIIERAIAHSGGATYWMLKRLER